MPIVLRVGTWPPALGHLCTWEALMHRTINIAKVNSFSEPQRERSPEVPNIFVFAIRPQFELYPSPLVSTFHTLLISPLVPANPETPRLSTLFTLFASGQDLDKSHCRFNQSNYNSQCAEATASVRCNRNWILVLFKVSGWGDEMVHLNRFR